jgi:hypothetical protein
MRTRSGGVVPFQESEDVKLYEYVVEKNNQKKSQVTHSLILTKTTNGH